MLLANDYLTKDVMLQLYAYTRRKMHRLKGSATFSRLASQDIAHDAITKTLSNERPWNSEKCPDLYAHLAGCAKSIISNQINLKETKTLDTQDNLDCFYEKSSSSQSIVDAESMFAHRANSSSSSTPEEIQAAISRFELLMDYLIENRNDLVEIARAMLVDEISKPQDLASHLGINVSNVNAKKLALKRIVRKMQEGEK